MRAARLQPALRHWGAGLALLAGGLSLAAQTRSPDAGVVALKALYLQSPLLADGMSRCQIVAPPDPSAQEDARLVQKALQGALGVEIAIVSPAAALGEEARGLTLIVLGNLANNAAIEKLYARHYCFTDAFYPGKDGYEVRTLHNPLGEGRNYVLLGGSDAAGMRAAALAFVRLIAGPGVILKTAEGKSATLARLHTASSTLHSSPPTNDAFVKSRSALLQRGLDSGLVRSTMGGKSGVLEAGINYFLTGDDGWGRIFRDCLLHYYDLAEPIHDWALLDLSNDPGGQYFWPWKLALVWDNVEEGAVFSDEDRLKITRLLLNLTRWVATCEHFYPDQPKGALYGMAGELRQGHPSYAALSLFFGAEYFRLYYPEIREFAPRYPDIARLFDSQELSYKSSDNATVYSPLSPGQFYCYAMTRGALDARTAANLKTYADYVLITTDNRGDAVAYGDTPTYLIGNPRGLGFLSKASWYFHDAGYRWGFDWIAARSIEAPGKNEFPYGDTWYQGLYYTDGPRLAPAGLQGVTPLRVDAGLYDYMQRRLKGAAAQSPPIDQCFDKLSMRRNFDPADEYLLMSGLSGVLYHGHEDGNSVLRLTWKDRVWLANMGYRGVAPNEHNSLMIRRDGQYQTIPAFAALEVSSDLPGTGFTRTTVRAYNGADWSRNILWRKGEYFLFFDEVTARQPGGLQAQLLWRGLGEARLEGNAFTLRQEGETFSIVNGDASRKTLSLKRPDKNSNWTHYPHADGIVRVLVQTRELRTDDRHVFVNHLHPGDAATDTLERVSEHAVRLRSGKKAAELIGLATGGNDCGDFRLQASAYAIRPEEVSAFAVEKMALAGLELQSDHPISFELNWSTQRGSIEATGPTEVRFNATGAVLDGQRSASTKDGYTVVSVPAGRHVLQLEGLRLQPLGTIVERIAAPTTPPAETARLKAPPLEQLWRLKSPGRLRTLATAVLDGESAGSVVVIVGDQARAVTADGRETWAYRAPAPITCLHLRDVDGDGKTEVILGAGSTLYLLDSAGRERWRRDCAFMTSTLSAITTADLEGDGRVEILAGNELSVVFAFSASGELQWKSYKDLGSNGVMAFLAEDLDGDGRAEIVAGSSRDHGTVMLTHDGNQAAWRVTGTHTVARAARLGDGSRQKVLMIGGPNARGPARIMDPITGRTRKLLTVPDDVVDIATADLDRNGEAEFVAGYAATGLYVYDTAGTLRHHAAFDSFISALVVADFDGDQRLDVAFGGPDGKLWITDAAGTVKATAEVGDAVVSLGVLRGPSRASLVVGTGSGTVFLYQVGK